MIRLAAVIGAHDENHVFERHHDHQRQKIVDRPPRMLLR